MSRRLVLLGCLVLIGWVAAMAFLLSAAQLPPSSSGRATAVFPPGRSWESILSATLTAGARPMRDTWLPGVAQVSLDDLGSVERLKALGAWLVLPPVPFEGLGLGGCSWMMPDADAAPPQIAKLRAGPL